MRMGFHSLFQPSQGEKVYPQDYYVEKTNKVSVRVQPKGKNTRIAHLSLQTHHYQV